MNKSDFLAQLSYKLRALPEAEKQDALEYYEGYIADSDNEAAAIAELGSPGEVAATILSNYVSQKPPGYGMPGPAPAKRPRMRTAYIAILAIFAVPIGIPLAAAAFGLIVGLLSVIFSVIVAGIAFLLAGIWSLAAAPAAFASDFWFGLLTSGMGIASLGIGILVFKGGLKLTSGFPAIVRIIRNRRRRGAVDMPVHSHVAHSPIAELHNDPQYANSMPLPAQETHEAPTPRACRRMPAIRFALMLIAVGAIMFGMAWFVGGSRGGVVYWESGGFGVESFSRNQLPADDPVGLELSENFHAIDIRASYGNVVILPTSSDNAFFTASSSVNIAVTNGILSISQRAASASRTITFVSMTFSSRDRQDIRLYLPASYFASLNESITIRTSSGNVRVEGDFSDLTVNTSSGNIYAANSTANAARINLRSASGRVTVDSVQGADSLDINTSSGRITVRNVGGIINRTDIRSASGHIELVGVQHSRSMNVNATSGRIEMTNSGWSTLAARTASGAINITGGSAADTTINTSSGTVRVGINGSQADFTLNLHSNSGRIDVNGSRVATRGSFTGLGGGDNTMNIRTASGRIDLDFSR